MKRNLFIYFASTLLVTIWVFAALSQLGDISTLVIPLERHRLPEWSISLMTRIIPTLEIITALLLYFKWTRYVGLIISTMLLFIFTLHVIITLSGPGTFIALPFTRTASIFKLSSPGQLLFNLIFLVISAISVNLYKHRYKYLVRQSGTTI